MISAPTASEILSIWERGVRQDRIDRALTLASGARPDLRREQLAALQLGRRDELLLRFRENLFGPSLSASATCPQCAGTVEFALQTPELLLEPQHESAEPFELSEGGVVVRFRVPTSADLHAIAQCQDVERARTVLLEACVQASRAGEPLSCETLSPALVAKLAASIAEADPLVDITLDLKCAECGHRWPVVFDIAAYLWIEIDALARRLMIEVHTLARSYGWHEADILAMGAGRRHFYLEMAG